MDPAVARLGCTTTARVDHGRATRAERHAERLRRDAERLGLPPPDRAEVAGLLVDIAREHFERSDGIVRIEWATAAGGPPRLHAVPRPLDPLPDVWRATRAHTLHPGPGEHRGVKQLDVPAYDGARRERARLGVEEVLLFDAADRLVEGSRTCCLVVLQDGRVATPDPGLGAVDGLGLAIVRETRMAPIQDVRLDSAALGSVRELLAVNVVRGVVPIVELDGEPVGGGVPGPWAGRLRPILAPIPRPARAAGGG